MDAPKHRFLYFTAPPRSGSTLLGTILNCIKNVIIINEPLNSHCIHKKEIIDSTFKNILQNLGKGFVEQRTDKEGNDITDTFPNEEIIWRKIDADFTQSTIVGIKKSFPSHGNKDYHEVFIKEWKSFVDWFVKEKRGKVIASIRNPIFTIFSWKTTFEALKDTTHNQCLAWNRMASSIFDIADQIQIVKYEKLLEDVNFELRRITNFLEREFVLVKEIPKIRENHNSLDYYLRSRNLKKENLKTDILTIFELCNPVASKFGYNLEEDLNSYLEL